MSNDVDEALLDALKEFHQFLEDGDYERAVALAPNLLDQINDESLCSAVSFSYAKSLLHEQQYEKVLQLTDPILEPLRIYALYRLERYQEAAERASTVNGDLDEAETIKKLIQAQSLYHLEDTEKAVSLYRELISANVVAEEDLYTNLVACYLSTALPFAANNNESQDLQAARALLSSPSSSDSTLTDFPYDLAFNVATLELLGSSSTSGRRMLQDAEVACRDALGDSDDVEKEVAPIVTNLEWSRSFWTGAVLLSSTNGEKLSSNLEFVRSLNQALSITSAAESLRAFPKKSSCPSNLTLLQRRIYAYDNAILQYRAGKLSECLESCDNMLTHLLPKPSTSGKKKKNATATHIPAAASGETLSPLSKEAVMWWESRIIVLQAHCKKQLGNQQDCEKLLSGILEKIAAAVPTGVRDHAYCYVLLHRHLLLEKNSTDETISMLQSEMPESLRTSPSVIATIAYLYERQGKDTEAIALVQQAGDEQALADFYMSQGNYEVAATIYEKLVGAANDDTVARAKWVQALTYTDPERAKQVWSEMSPELVNDNDAEEENGAELEARELPRLKSSRRSQEISTTVVTETRNKKSREAVLRRRARQREKYLDELSNKGLYRAERPTKPDPERWLPKYERSYNRRRRNRAGGAGVHRGAQGGISEKDAAKLDIVARQQARASGETDGPGTAHMTVSSTGGGPARKGGRRR